MKNVSSEKLELLGSIVAEQWLTHISVNDFSLLMDILSERYKSSNIDKKVLSSIDNLLFGVKMEYGDLFQEKKKNYLNGIEEVLHSISVAEKNLNQKIFLIQEKAIIIYQEILNKNKIKEIIKEYYSHDRKRPSFGRLMKSESITPKNEAFGILITNKIIKKGLFGVRVINQKTNDEIKNIVENAFSSEKYSISHIKSVALTRQKDK